MKWIVVFEDYNFRNFLPVVYWRAVFELRCGKDTLLDKIAEKLRGKIVLFVRTELEELVRLKYSDYLVNQLPAGSDCESILFVNGRWFADADLPDLPVNTCLVKGSSLIAAHLLLNDAEAVSANMLVQAGGLEKLMEGKKKIEAGPDITVVNYLWDLIHRNADEIRRQCNDGQKEGTILSGVNIIGETKKIHIGRGTVIQPGVLLDAEEGPIWIDNNVKIMGNSIIQGPCYIGPGSLIQGCAYIREGTSLGPVCKVGGEVEESIIQGYSNKQHYGFLGHSYIGEWVNCGAGLTNSDLKNTYGPVAVTIDGETFIDTGHIFMGLIMGDHSKVGIGVYFPTGAVMGTASMVAVGGYAPKFVPSLKWVTDMGREDYNIDKAIVVAERAMARRGITLTEAHKRLFKALPDITSRYEKRD